MKKFFGITNILIYIYGFLLSPVFMYNLFKINIHNNYLIMLYLAIVVLQILPLLYVDMNFKTLTRETKVAIISISILGQILANIVMLGNVQNFILVISQGIFVTYELIYILYLNHEIVNEKFDIN